MSVSIITTSVCVLTLAEMDGLHSSLVGGADTWRVFAATALACLAIARATPPDPRNKGSRHTGIVFGLGLLLCLALMAYAATRGEWLAAGGQAALALVLIRLRSARKLEPPLPPPTHRPFPDVKPDSAERKIKGPPA